MDWYEYTNEIPLNTLKVWRDQILSTAQFKCEGWTGNCREPYRHWAAYPEYEGIYKDIFDCLDVSFKDDGFKLTVDRVIVNMYNHGDSSWFHTDCTKDNAYTVVLFMNESWNINWAGDFVLSDGWQDILYCTAPIPGKFVLFKGNIPHCARPVSREAQFPRMGLAIQCTNNLKI